MLIRQIFDSTSSTYTYLVADQRQGKALLIDPVLEKTDSYLQLLNELNLTLEYALDTHVHADHITALGKLRELTQCKTVTSKASGVSCSDIHVVDNDSIICGETKLDVLTTPGHTSDSVCFYLNGKQGVLFSGDTLLIRGTGRTDFQNGSSSDLYHSLFDKLLKLPDSTIIYPGHDYKGWTQSTIREEKQYNPRLQVANIDAFIEIMDNLNLPNPKMMDIAVPANKQCGSKPANEQEQPAMNIKKHTDSFFTCEQITVNDVSTLAHQGFKLLINNRPDHEAEGQPTHQEMAAAAAAAGIDYVYIPIQRSLPTADIQALSNSLNKATGPVLAFCRTGTRSTNLWIMTQLDTKQAQAIDHAKSLGYDLALCNNALQSNN